MLELFQDIFALRELSTMDGSHLAKLMMGRRARKAGPDLAARRA